MTAPLHAPASLRPSPRCAGSSRRWHGRLDRTSWAAACRRHCSGNVKQGRPRKPNSVRLLMAERLRKNTPRSPAIRSWERPESGWRRCWQRPTLSAPACRMRSGATFKRPGIKACAVPSADTDYRSRRFRPIGHSIIGDRRSASLGTHRLDGNCELLSRVRGEHRSRSRAFHRNEGPSQRVELFVFAGIADSGGRGVARRLAVEWWLLRQTDPAAIAD